MSDSSRSDLSPRHRPTRAFARALVATSYLLGRRGAALVAGISLSDEETLRDVADLRRRLSSGSRERRAQALAAEVSRLVRSLRSRRAL